MFVSEKTFGFQEAASFVQDREDLLVLLKMRFDEIPTGVIEAVYELITFTALDRLMLVADDAPSIRVFLEELEHSGGSLRSVGERFNPLATLKESGGTYGG